MRRVTKYKCPKCGCPKELIDDTDRNGNGGFVAVPDSVICGWRGCDGRAVKI